MWARMRCVLACACPCVHVCMYTGQAPRTGNRGLDSAFSLVSSSILCLLSANFTQTSTSSAPWEACRPVLEDLPNRKIKGVGGATKDRRPENRQSKGIPGPAPQGSPKFCLPLTQSQRNMRVPRSLEGEQV